MKTSDLVGISVAAIAWVSLVGCDSKTEAEAAQGNAPTHAETTADNGPPAADESPPQTPQPAEAQWRVTLRESDRPMTITRLRSGQMRGVSHACVEEKGDYVFIHAYPGKDSRNHLIPTNEQRRYYGGDFEVYENCFPCIGIPSHAIRRITAMESPVDAGADSRFLLVEYEAGGETKLVTARPVWGLDLEGRQEIAGQSADFKCQFRDIASVSRVSHDAPARPSVPASQATAKVKLRSGLTFDFTNFHRNEETLVGQPDITVQLPGGQIGTAKPIGGTRRTYRLVQNFAVRGMHKLVLPFDKVSTVSFDTSKPYWELRNTDRLGTIRCVGEEELSFQSIAGSSCWNAYDFVGVCADGTVVQFEEDILAGISFTQTP